MVAASIVQFGSNAGAHANGEGRACPGRSFTVIMAGTGGAYTSTVECATCRRRLQAWEDRLINLNLSLTFEDLAKLAANRSLDKDGLSIAIGRPVLTESNIDPQGTSGKVVFFLDESDPRVRQ